MKLSNNRNQFDASIYELENKIKNFENLKSA